MTHTENSSVVTNDTQGPLEIFIPPEIDVGTYLHVQHGTETTPVFLPADGEATWSLLPSLISLLLGSAVQPENTYFCILKVTEQA